MGQLRENKKRETRQRISDIATELFFAHGFEAVTIDDIAIAAKVSKMTVFNYFARKEELLLDREDDLKLVPFRQALRQRQAGQSHIDALRAFVQEMNDQKYPLCHINKQMIGWWRVVNASPSVRARLRELADEATEGLAVELGGTKPNGPMRLAAGLIVLTVRTAREEAIRLIECGASTKKANATFLAMMDQGLSLVERIVMTELKSNLSPSRKSRRVSPLRQSRVEAGALQKDGKQTQAT